MAGDRGERRVRLHPSGLFGGKKISKHLMETSSEKSVDCSEGSLNIWPYSL
jgi:hypothetical protein